MWLLLTLAEPSRQTKKDHNAAQKLDKLALQSAVESSVTAGLLFARVSQTRTSGSDYSVF